MLYLQHFETAITYPARTTPAWASKSDRWYQLDAPAYALAEGYEILRSRLGAAPDFLILASPFASNLTDREFAISGATSPSKFVHTLPNIRAVSLLQTMEWSGPMLCVQNDPTTIVSGLEEAFVLFEAEPEIHIVWVVVFDPSSTKAHFFIATRKPPLFAQKDVIEIVKAAAGQHSTDLQFLDWVYNKAASGFNLSRSYRANFPPEFKV